MVRNKASKSVECKVNDNLSIIINNVRKVYGHDDSLPFNADVFIRKDRVIEQVATAWNDGWGGETCIDILPNKQEVVRSLEEVIGTYNFECGKYTFPAKLSDVVELLACAAIFSKYNNTTIEKLVKF